MREKENVIEAMRARVRVCCVCCVCCVCVCGGGMRKREISKGKNNKNRKDMDGAGNAK